MASSNFDEFLTAFNAVESFLKAELRISDTSGDVSFKRLLDDYSQRYRNKVSRTLYQRLDSLREVRNLLVHQRSFTDQRFANPTDDAVAAMRAARDELLHPPKALSVL